MSSCVKKSKYLNEIEMWKIQSYRCFKPNHNRKPILIQIKKGTTIPVAVNRLELDLTIFISQSTSEWHNTTSSQFQLPIFVTSIRPKTITIFEDDLVWFDQPFFCKSEKTHFVDCWLAKFSAWTFNRVPNIFEPNKKIAKHDLVTFQGAPSRNGSDRREMCRECRPKVRKSAQIMLMSYFSRN